MPSARDKLITDNMRLVYHMYGKIGDGPIKENYKEDIISEGMLGLCKAADTFDESRGVRFSTYAAMCIRNAMLMFIRKTSKHYPHEVSLNMVIGRDAEDSVLTLADVIEDESQSEDEIITRIMLEDFEEKQTPIDKKIINELKQGKRQIEIGRELRNESSTGFKANSKKMREKVSKINEIYTGLSIAFTVFCLT
ncbi:MAG: sigma-70 family RNA polymerase sigma factor [Clostridium sp.]|nr:MAG: sigma-70 family RNA polymerase sigma factor [Clostridium sp.]